MFLTDKRNMTACGYVESSEERYLTGRRDHCWYFWVARHIAINMYVSVFWRLAHTSPEYRSVYRHDLAKRLNIFDLCTKMSEIEKKINTFQ
jgi:hypothetical protein